MDNWNTQAAWRYHRGTRHPHGELMDPAHFYDFSLRPRLFKIYPGLEPLPLPLDLIPKGRPALEAIAQSTWPSPQEGQELIVQANLDFPTLARLLFFSAGITKHLTYPGHGAIPFRAAACTGALYHIELYVICDNLPGGDLPGSESSGLEAGVYHFDPSQNAVRRLREGDYRPVLAAASGEEPSIAQAPAILIYTDIFFRNAVKYQVRAYRHSFWDSGTILANTLAMAASEGLPARLALGFVDEQVNRLLDLDERREASLALVALGAGPGIEQAALPPVEPLGLEVEPVAEEERFFPAIYELHQASSLVVSGEVVRWRERARAIPPAEVGPGEEADLVPLRPLPKTEQSQDPIGKVIVRRGSTRRFARQSISFEQLSTLLQQSMRGFPADFLGPAGIILNDLYLIVHAVDGLETGTYVYRPQKADLQLLKTGDFRRQAGELALGQDLAADAAVNVYFLADLGRALDHLGNRGYRAAQMEASLTAGKMYLAAYAQRFGATGLTFYDDYVTDFFSPHAAGKSVMFLIALGMPEKVRK